MQCIVGLIASIAGCLAGAVSFLPRYQKTLHSHTVAVWLLNHCPDTANTSSHGASARKLFTTTAGRAMVTHTHHSFESKQAMQPTEQLITLPRNAVRNKPFGLIRFFIYWTAVKIYSSYQLWTWWIVLYNCGTAVPTYVLRTISFFSTTWWAHSAIPDSCSYTRVFLESREWESY